jgi:predicted enzyme related to lactoylglutathione lyase
MGDYDDYIMKDASGKVTGGICHARGKNNYLPPVWIIYIPVSNIDESLKACVENGGKVLGEKRKMGPTGVYCLIQDPAGACVMITEGSFY